MAHDNTATFPILSARGGAALERTGAKVRDVQLSVEAHRYRPRERNGHTLGEMVSWLDTYVRLARTRRAAMQ